VIGLDEKNARHGSPYFDEIPGNRGNPTRLRV
jgi:hypothetical protein